MAIGRSLLAYAITRAALAVPMLLILLTAVFFVLRVLPGDPVLALWGGREPPPDVVEAARVQLGLDKPPILQYVDYMSRFFRGDFGLSIGVTYVGRPVIGEIMNRLPATVELSIGAMFVATTVGLLTGVVGGARRDTKLDVAIRLYGTIIPVITVLGLQFAILFAGAVLTEKTFSIDGIGLLLLQSVDSKDMTMIQGVIVIYATIIVVISLVIDILGAVIDPRIRL